MSHITFYPVDYTQRKITTSLLNLPSLRTLLLVAYCEVFWGFHFASNMRGKEKLECDHGLKLTHVFMLWLSKTLKNGLNFKWTTNRTASHAWIQVCALGVLLNEDLDIMTLLSEGRKCMCHVYLLPVKMYWKRAAEKRALWLARNEFPAFKLQWPVFKLNFSRFSKLANQRLDQRTIRDLKPVKNCCSNFIQKGCLCCCDI